MHINNYLSPIQFQERTPLNKGLEFIDSLLSNPISAPIVLEKRGHVYSKIEQQPVPTPLLLTLAKVSVYSLLYFQPLIAASLLVCSLMVKIAVRSKIVPILTTPRPTTLNRRLPIAPPMSMTPKQIVFKWVQKSLCSHYFPLFASGMSVYLPELSDQPNVKITVRKGTEEAIFDSCFLQTVPYLSAILQGQYTENQAPNKLVLSSESPFTLETIRKLQKLKGRGIDFDNLEKFDQNELDYLSHNIVLALLDQTKKVHSDLQPFQKWIEDNNSGEDIPKLGEIDLTPFSKEPPQVKVATHNINLADWNFPELAPTIEFLDKPDKKIHEYKTFVADYIRSNPPVVCRYLTVNAILEAYLDQLLLQKNDRQNPHLLPDNFLALIEEAAPWHSYVTTLYFNDIAIDPDLLPQITARFPNLNWLSVNFCGAEPTELLDWIHSWNAPCSKLHVLSLSGIRNPCDDVAKRVLSEMKELDVFEILK